MTTASIDLTNSSVDDAKGLVAKILAFAKGRGVDQGTLAERAGISAEALSRLKKQGGCRLTTTLELARAAGFGRLHLAAGPVGRTAASLSARKLSAGRRLAIDANELISALRTGAPGDQLTPHLLGFFEELPIELVHDVILDEGLNYAGLLPLAKQLGAEGETLEWLEEMAGDGLAETA